jgi:hypothetical protein
MSFRETPEWAKAANPKIDLDVRNDVTRNASGALADADVEELIAIGGSARLWFSDGSPTRSRRYPLPESGR